MSLNPISQIKSHSIIDYFDYEGIALSKNGKNYSACCPLHEEKTPSFYINPDKNKWFCYGSCKKSGDVIDFVCEYKNLEKNESIEYLCKIFNIPLKRKKEKIDNKSKEKEIIEINKLVYEFYQKNIFTGLGIKYFLSRINNKSLIETFKVGYALDVSESGDWQHLTSFLREGGVDVSLAEKIGIIRKSDKGIYYDSFRGRLIFPIFSTSGQCIGFNTRKTQYSSCKGPKYLVSNETEVFKKSEVVYGYHLTAKEIKNKNEVIHVEGIWDFLNLWNLGFKNTIPHLGSPKFIPNVDNHFIMMDPDKAGIKYSLDFANVILKKGKMARICEGKKDPSDLNKNEIEEGLKNSLSYIDIFMKYHYKYEDNIEHKMIVLDTISKELKGISTEVLYLYGEICAKILKIPLQVVLFRMGLEDRIKYKELYSY